MQNVVLILSLNSFDKGEARFFVSRFIDRLINFTNFPFIIKIDLISVVSKKNEGTSQCHGSVHSAPAHDMIRLIRIEIAENVKHVVAKCFDLRFQRRKLNR